MNLAIFLDAHPVCGDAHLLQAAQQVLQRLATDNDAMLARFAAAMDAFGNSHGWWNRLLGLDDQQGMHLKKEGIFPLVHGVRSLALAEHLQETSTTARIETLVARNVITPALGADLTQSLHFCTQGFSVCCAQGVVGTLHGHFLGAYQEFTHTLQGGVFSLKSGLDGVQRALIAVLFVQDRFQTLNGGRLVGRITGIDNLFALCQLCLGLRQLALDATHLGGGSVKQKAG
jgi:hypothetical protein